LPGTMILGRYIWIGAPVSTGAARKGDVASICGAMVLNGDGFGGERESGEGTLRAMPGRGVGSIAPNIGGCAGAVEVGTIDVESMKTLVTEAARG
jgi:hypothetical protein